MNPSPLPSFAQPIEDDKPVNKNCPKGLTIGAKKLLESKGYLVEQDEFCDIHLGLPVEAPNRVLSHASDKVAIDAIKGISSLGVLSKSKAEAIQEVVNIYYGRE